MWIWTDVDGIMSADPRLVPSARVLDTITYAEAAELAQDIDLGRAQAALAKAQADDSDEARAAALRAETRVRAATSITAAGLQH